MTKPYYYQTHDGWGRRSDWRERQARYDERAVRRYNKMASDDAERLRVTPERHAELRAYYARLDELIGQCPHRPHTREYFAWINERLAASTGGEKADG